MRKEYVKPFVIVVEAYCQEFILAAGSIIEDPDTGYEIDSDDEKRKNPPDGLDMGGDVIWGEGPELEY